MAGAGQNVPTQSRRAKAVPLSTEKRIRRALQQACSEASHSLEPLSHGGLYPIWARKLIAEEMFRADRCNLAIEA